MLNEWKFYGRVTETLEKNLTKKDREILDNFMKYCSATAGIKRLIDYRRYMIQFRDVIDKPLDKLEGIDFIEVWGLIKKAPHEEHTKQMLYRIVKRFCKWYKKDIELLESLRKPKYLYNEERLSKANLPTAEEFQKMLHSADNFRDKALLITMFETASRPHEIAQARWKHINWDKEEIEIFSNKSKRRTRAIPKAIVHLKRWFNEWILPDVKQEDFIFPSRKGSRVERSNHLSVSKINYIVKKCRDRAGILKPITSYSLRHAKGTEIHKKGLRGKSFSIFMGHVQDSKMESVYAHVDDEDINDEYLKLYDIKEIPENKKEEYEQKIKILEKKIVDSDGFHDKKLKVLEQKIQILTEIITEMSQKPTKKIISR